MPTDLCRWCGHTYELTLGHTCTPTVATSGTGPAEAASSAPAGPPDLAQAIQAAAKALRHQHGLIWSEPAIERQARLCVEAAWGVLTQPLADLQRDLDYTTGPDEWDAEQAFELDRLAAFEVAIREATHQPDYVGIIAGVSNALVALEQARERPNG